LADLLYNIATPTNHTSISARAVAPHLPGHDPDPESRATQLEVARSDYQWNWDSTNATGVPLLQKLPIREFFSVRWLALIAKAKIKIKANEVAPPFWLSKKSRAKSIRDYAELFVILDEPSVAKNDLWATDESFGEQRLSGANPLSIRRVLDVQEISLLTPPGVTDLLYGSSLNEEVAAGRLFVVDHREALAAITADGSVTLSGQVFPKSLPKSAALFWWNRWDKRLMPISIGIGAPNSEQLFSPADAGPWIKAKVAFQACDAVVHEMSSHLGRTHLVMGGIAIAARRQLAEAHPIYRLLAPHFRFMLALNQEAEKGLIAPDGALDVAVGAPIGQVVGVAVQAYSTWNFTDHAFPNDISRRGVAPSSGLPAYAFRDDAALLWTAIERYVAEYVSLYYSNDLAVAEDPELSAWANEVARAAPNGAAINGFPALDRVERLVFALTHIVFVCSVQHSAVNYTQHDYLAFAPNSPFATWAPQTEQDVLKLLPPIGAAEDQLNMLYQLTAFRYDQLGDYEGEYSLDERANAATRAFLAGMPAIDEVICCREKERWQSYQYLRPHNIINSISI
jgi:arachidonate 15-lipoxygenase